MAVISEVTTKSNKKVKNHPFIYGIRKFCQHIIPRLVLFHQINLIYYRLLLKRTQFYQPLYNFSIISSKRFERRCVDRADRINYDMMTSHPEKKTRILDIGCNLGYFSLYFADRGCDVSSIDRGADNIAICQILNKVNKKDVKFSVGEFTDTFVDGLQPGQYDVVFLFSVIHHVTYEKGQAYAKQLMRNLLEKIPVLYIELAVKNETFSSPWRDALGEDELDVFSDCNDISITPLGYFPTSRDDVKRPLYKVARKNVL